MYIFIYIYICISLSLSIYIYIYIYMHTCAAALPGSVNAAGIAVLVPYVHIRSTHTQADTTYVVHKVRGEPNCVQNEHASVCKLTSVCEWFMNAG